MENFHQKRIMFFVSFFGIVLPVLADYRNETDVNILVLNTLYPNTKPVSFSWTGKFEICVFFQKI